MVAVGDQQCSVGGPQVNLLQLPAVAPVIFIGAIKDQCFVLVLPENHCMF